MNTVLVRNSKFAIARISVIFRLALFLESFRNQRWREGDFSLDIKLRELAQRAKIETNNN